MADIKITNLKRNFGAFKAVDDVTFHIRDGEFVFFLGPSGCGKTTTLRMIAGLLMPSDGKIEIGGRDVTYLKPRYRNVGMVFQQNVLYHHLSVYENLAYPLKVRGMSKADIKAKVQQVAELLQIDDVLQRSTEKLSGGQAQRVAIGRMLVRDADVFLMDEPISHLDAKLRAHMRIELRHLQQELNRTTVFVSHDQLEAMSMADRIAVINDGTIQQFDTPQNIFDTPTNEFVAGFVGEPHMNIMDATIADGAAHIGGHRISLDADWLTRNSITPGKIRLGVRPEHLMLIDEATPTSIAEQVEFVEPMGAESLFSFTIDCKPFKVRATTQSTDHMLAVKDRPMNIQIPQDRIYLFSPTTGKTLAQALFTNPSGETQ